MQKSITLKRGLKFWDKSYYQFIATVGVEIAEALNYAHENNIIHGDLKPSNVLLTHEAIPMVVDFGLSKDIKKMATSKTEEFTGTLPYAAPEQIKDNILSKKTDIWSFGVTLYELLTFRNPFRENTVKKTVDKISSSYVPPLKSYDKKMPWELEAIVFKCLERQPENRYNTTAELTADLNNYLEFKPIKAKRIGIKRRVCLRIKRYPKMTIVSIILFISLIAASTFIYLAKLNSLINKAESLRMTGEFKDVRKIYEKVLKLSPNIPLTKTVREKALVGIGDFLQMHYPLEALPYYEKCLQINPKNFLALQGEVLVYGATKNEENEKKLLLRLLQFYPFDWITVGNYVDFLKKRGEVNLALNFLAEKCKNQEFVKNDPLVYMKTGTIIEDLYKKLNYNIEDLKKDYYKIKIALLKKGFEKKLIDKTMDEGVLSINIYRNAYLWTIKSGEELQLIAKEKNIISKNPDEKYLNTIAGNNLKLWMLWSYESKNIIRDSMEDKCKVVDSMKEYFKKNGIVITKPSIFYASLINAGLLGLIKENTYNFNQGDEIDNILLLNTLKYSAILEGDYDNGEDKISLIKEIMGGDGFERFKRDNPERLEYFTAN